MKEMRYCKGWKAILDNGRQSVSNHHEGNPLSLVYPVNKRVYPKDKMSRLFFFRSKNRALDFAEHENGTGFYYHKVKIVKCIAYGVTQPEKILVACSCHGILDFGQPGNKVYVYTYMAPKGTYLAESIKCLE